jgi:protein transport protein SEC24
MYQLPATSALLSDVKIPLAVIVNPLAELGERDTPVSVVDFGEEGPIRCGRCKAYVNAFCRFRDGGAAYTCPFCTMVNQVPRTYQCGLDQYGRRRDFYERPELRFGSCDFAVPAAYNVRATPQVPTFVFIVDVSFHAVANGALQACVDAISDALEDLPEDSTTRVGLITFDDAVHFYDIKVRVCVCVCVCVCLVLHVGGRFTLHVCVVWMCTGGNCRHDCCGGCG